MTDPWEFLINYESNELVRRRYKELHNREANAAHALEISASFSQGAAYFSSAKNADKVVRPLLLYYGVLSLARGTAIFLRRGIREACLSQAHGLSTVDWGKTLAQPNSDIGDIRIRVTKNGSIHEFAEATGNQTLMRLNKNIINQTVSHDTLIYNQEFMLSDLLSRFPELMQQYTRWRSDGRCAIGGFEGGSPAGSVIILINKKWGTVSVNHDLVKRVVEHLDVLSIQEASDAWHVSIHVPSGEIDGERNIPGLWDYVPPDGFGIGPACAFEQKPTVSAESFVL